MKPLCVWRKSCIYKHGHKPCPSKCPDFINKNHIAEELERIETAIKEEKNGQKVQQLFTESRALPSASGKSWTSRFDGSGLKRVSLYSRSGRHELNEEISYEK